MKLVLVDLLLAVIRYCFLGIYRESKILVKVTLTNNLKDIYTQPAFTCSKLTIESLDQGELIVSCSKLIVQSLLLTLTIFHTLF